MSELKTKTNDELRLEWHRIESELSDTQLVTDEELIYAGELDSRMHSIILELNARDVLSEYEYMTYIHIEED